MTPSRPNLSGILSFRSRIFPNLSLAVPSFPAFPTSRRCFLFRNCPVKAVFRPVFRFSRSVRYSGSSEAVKWSENAGNQKKQFVSPESFRCLSLPSPVFRYRYAPFRMLSETFRQFFRVFPVALRSLFRNPSRRFRYAPYPSQVLPEPFPYRYVPFRYLYRNRFLTVSGFYGTVTLLSGTVPCFIQPLYKAVRVLVVSLIKINIREKNRQVFFYINRLFLDTFSGGAEKVSLE